MTVIPHSSENLQLGSSHASLPFFSATTPQPVELTEPENTTTEQTIISKRKTNLLRALQSSEGVNHVGSPTSDGHGHGSIEVNIYGRAFILL